MSGKYWWPALTVSRVAAADQFVPSDELRTKIFDWPLPSSPFQTTCTPVLSAVTAERLANRANVKPLGQLYGASPQSPAPLPLNWVESKGRNSARTCGWLKETPPSVDRSTEIVSAVEF